MFLNDPDSTLAFATQPAPAIRECGSQSGSLLLVPVGSLEQHGNHLPVATDAILAEAVAHAGAETADSEIPLLVTPPVWPGHSPHHLSLGGTLSVDVTQLHDLLCSIARSALTSGFDALMFCNGHGGNSSTITSAVSTIGSTHPGLETTGFTYFELAESFIDTVRESDIGGMAHGGEFETSLMLHLHPELVHDETMEAEPLEQPHPHSLEDMFAGGPVSVYREFESYAETGAIGVPEMATAEKGATILDGLGEAIAEVIHSVHQTASGA